MPLLHPGLAFSQSLAGDWQGTLGEPKASLRVIVHLVQRPTGEFTGTLDSPDQRASGLPLASVAIENSRVRFSVPQVGGAFEGTLDQARSTIDGTWTQGIQFPLKLTRSEAQTAPSRRRPQTPQPPFPYREELVSYSNPASGFVLAATLTLPPGAGPFPVVLLITGSGPQDRDEATVGHRPFLVLADALARRGIAVLRADDRGIGRSTGSFAAATTADFATDAAAGVAYLRTRSEVDTRHIGLLGHSEGGFIAPLLASQDPGVSFVVMLAGPAVRGDEIILEQVATLARAMGAPEETINDATTRQRQLLELIRTAPDDQRAARVRDWIAGRVPENQVESQLQQLLSPWYRAFLTLDPAPALRSLAVPVLAIFGSKDLQVPAENAARARELLAANPRAEAVVFDGLNHFFQTAGTGLPAEYSQIEETIAPAVLDKIGRWIEGIVTR